MPEFIVEVLTDQHDTSRFESTKPTLDGWLQKDAASSDARNITRTYVMHVGDDIVVGYYTLMPCTIERSTLTRRQSRGLPDKISAYLLARLALDHRWHGQRLGTQLLTSALERVVLHGGELGGRYVVVDAIDDQAASFYVHHGFDRVDGVEGRLLIAVKDIEAKMNQWT